MPIDLETLPRAPHDYSLGHKEGYRQGYEEGRLAGLRESISSENNTVAALALGAVSAVIACLGIWFVIQWLV